MKSVWTMPKMHIQQFEANESVAACYYVECTLWNGEGTAYHKGEYSAYDRYAYDLYGKDYCDGAKLWHSKNACGNYLNNIVSDDKHMYENSKNHGNLVFEDIVISSDWKTISWTNKDTRTGQEWHHEGNIILQDGNRPNHS